MGRRVDPIKAEVIARFLLATAEEMGATLMRTAFSPNIKERADCSTAIFDAGGEVIALAQRVPIHLGSMVGAIDYSVAVQRVSDDDHWKDFSRGISSLTPRLLPAYAQATRRFDSALGDTVAYARVQSWQVLQDDDPASRIVAPYRREPQVGLRQRGAAGGAVVGRTQRGDLEPVDVDAAAVRDARGRILGERD